MLAGIGIGLGATLLSSASPGRLEVTTQVCGEDATRGYEPHLSVDPHNPRHLVATWSLHGGLGAAVAISHDGGRTWEARPIPKLTYCETGAIWGDTWSSIGADGAVYVSALGLLPDAPDKYEVVEVSRDGGTTWERPSLLEHTTGADPSLDRSSVTADPNVPGLAYSAWSYWFPDSHPAADAVHFTRSDDWGRNWTSTAKAAPDFDIASAPEPIALPTGGVAVAYGDYSVKLDGTSAFTVYLARSPDGGRTWAPPKQVAEFSPTGVQDPQNYVEIRADGQTVPLATHGDRFYLCLVDSALQGTSHVRLIESSDGGATWGTPTVVAHQSSQIFLPEVAVAGDGTVGVLWYDFENFHRGAPTLATDVWLSTSHDGGRSWSRRHLAGSFDMRQAIASDRGPFLGDYMGLVGLPHGFAAAFVQSPPGAHNGDDYVYFVSTD